MQVEVFETFDEIRERAEAWDQFMLSVNAEVFLTFDWCRTWWEFYGGRRILRICWFTSDGHTVAILPLLLDRIGVWPGITTFCRMVSTDYVPVAVSLPIVPEAMSRVMDALRDRLLAWKVSYVQLGPLAGNYAHLTQLCAASSENLAPGYRTTLRQMEVQTYFTIQESWEDQLAALSKQERKRLRQVYRDVETSGSRIESRLASPSSFDATFDGFVAMHQARWASEGKAGHFRAWPHALAFHRNAARCQLEKDRLRLLEVSLDGTPVGYKYAYRFGATYYAFLDARSLEAAAGRITYARLLFGELVRTAMAEGGIRWIDSMRGEYDHKSHLGGETRPVHMLDVVSNETGKRMRVGLLRLFATALDRGYYRLGRRRIVPRLGLGRSSFAGLWVRLHPLSW